ncbi:DNAJ heat shock N-terminal domain-containing protein [Wolffia australiana]
MARPVILIISLALIYASADCKSRDLYKVLGVDKNANQRDIQKAFHRLSLQYHPDKNKNKGAQEKFAEINNAYDILSDEEKRKNYDLYGDEKGAPGFEGGNFGGGNYGGQGGYSYFTSGGSNGGGFSFNQEGWQGGSHQNPHSFSFSFGGNPSRSGSPFDFGFNDLFSNFFGGQTKGRSQFGGFTTSSSDDSRESLPDVDSLTFKKEIVDQGLTWLLMFYSPTVKGYHTSESLIHDVSLSLQGALKAGKVNCQKEAALCGDHGARPSRKARIFVYSFKNAEKGELIEYGGELNAKSLKTFCHENLPGFSTRHSRDSVDLFPTLKEKLPQVLLLSTKTETPIIWRVLSGLYQKRFKFHDAQVLDITDERVKRFKVNALPAIIGRLSNGEEHVLKSGIHIKDLSSGINNMKTLIDKFERTSKKASSDSGKDSSQSEARQEDGLPILTILNFETICSERTPLCLIGAFKSTKAKKKMESILSQISQKTMTRRQSQPLSPRDSISYSLLDASKHKKFIESFEDSAHKNSDLILLAYKPRKGKFALLGTSELTLEDAESFVGSALNGDLKFSEIRRTPTFEQ